VGVYARYKRSPEGFRALVELLESTPVSRRKKMIDAGMAEDPEFTQKALEYVMNFEDIVALPDVELAELLARAPARVTAFAVRSAPEEVKMRFIRNSKPQIGAEVKSLLTINIGMREIGGAQLRLIGMARELERKGLLRTKVIPLVISAGTKPSGS
jgi:flagellar motor switch protein FliG